LLTTFSEPAYAIAKTVSQKQPPAPGPLFQAKSAVLGDKLQSKKALTPLLRVNEAALGDKLG